MEEDFFRKMFGINKNSKEYLGALDDYYKSIKPLEDEMHNKISEIIKLKKRNSRYIKTNYQSIWIQQKI